MKSAVLIAVSILISGIIVGVSLDKLCGEVRRLNSGLIRLDRPFPQQVTVNPGSGTFRVSGALSSAPSEPKSGSATSDREAYTRVQNVSLVSQNVTPEQLAEASKSLVGRWRDENSYVDYRGDGTCTWTLDDGTTRQHEWKIEGDTILEWNNGKIDARRRLLELGPTRFTYQQFPTGSIWRAWRVNPTPQPVVTPTVEQERK